MAGYAEYTTVTPRFRAAFVNLFEPKPNDEDPSAKPKYGVTMLFEEGEDLAEIKQLATKLMTDKFGTDKAKWPKGFNKPWRDQGEKDKNNPDASGKTYDGFVTGRLFFNASTAQQPEVVDEYVKPVISAKTVYSGCYMLAQITLFWYEKKGNKGIGVSLNSAQKVDDGEPLGGAAPAASSVFSPVKANKKKAPAESFDGDDEDPMA
jgi:hypothetical protein